MELIEKDEMELAEFSLQEALRLGVEAVSVTLNKSVSDTCIMRDGIMDNIQHRLDRNLTFRFFSHGHFGSFSTNRLNSNDLQVFIGITKQTKRKGLENYL